MNPQLFWLVVYLFLWKIWVNWDDYSQYMGKKTTLDVPNKPPSSIGFTHHIGGSLDHDQPKIPSTCHLRSTDPPTNKPSPPSPPRHAAPAAPVAGAMGVVTADGPGGVSMGSSVRSWRGIAGRSSKCEVCSTRIYHPVMTNITNENGHWWWVFPWNTVIFHGYQSGYLT